MMYNKYNCLLEWLKGYGENNGWIYFNTSDMKEGNTSLNSVTNVRIVKEFIDGSKEIELPFGISAVKQYDTEQSDLNLDAMTEVESLMQWIEENEENLDFGDTCEIHSVTLATRCPDISVDTEQALAKYVFTGIVKYTENTNN